MLLHTLSRTLHTLFTHCGLFWPIFFQFQHVRCLIACIQAEKFNGDTFIQFLTLLDTLSHLFTHSIHTFHTLFFYFDHFFPISTCWVSKSKYSSCEIQWWYFKILSHTFSHSTHNYHALWAIMAKFCSNFNMLGV